MGCKAAGTPHFAAPPRLQASEEGEAMARGKASSSDKLLEMIRGKKKEQKAPQTTPSHPAPASPPTPPGAKKAKDKKNTLSLGKAKKGKGRKAPAIGSGFSTKGGGSKAVIVGVDLGPDSLRLAKAAGSTGKRKLLGYKRIPYDPSAPPGSAGFVDFLRDRLKEFSKGTRKVEVWTLISSAKAELWNISIPKVPRKQVLDAVYWSVKKEKQFDENEFILDFDVLGEIAEKGVPKLAVTVYLAPRKQVEDVVDLFSKAGFKLHGVTIAPIAIQSLFRSKWVETKAGTYANLYVGRNWSRIDIFNKANLVLSRGIKAGTNSMVEALMESYNLEHGGGVGGSQTIAQDEPVISMSLDEEESIILDEIPSQTMDGTGPGMRGMDLEQAKQVLVGKLLGGPLRKGSSGSELGETEVVEMILPAAERLVRQIERTFEYHSTTMGNDPVEQIFFSGTICTNKLILQYMYSQLGIESLVLDPLHPDNPNVGRIEGPESVIERIEYNLVVALALSDNSITPNLIFTYKDKEKQRQTTGIDKAIYAVTVIAVIVLAGVAMWQRDGIKEAEAERLGLEQQLKVYQPPASEQILLELAQKVDKTHQALKKASRRYEGLTLLSELSGITPNYVQLLSVEMSLGPYVPLESLESKDDKAKGKGKGKPANELSNKLMVIDGFIEGEDVDKFESAFTRYLIRLENSPLFRTPTFNKEDAKLEEFPNRGTVYRFLVSVPVE